MILTRYPLLLLSLVLLQLLILITDAASTNSHDRQDKDVCQDETCEMSSSSDASNSNDMSNSKDDDDDESLWTREELVTKLRYTGPPSSKPVIARTKFGNKGDDTSKPPEVCFAFLSCCNRTDLLKETLKGLIRHMEEDEPEDLTYEIAWVDNGSDAKNQREIVEQFEIEHVLMLKNNMGLAWGMNALMENLCTAPYVMLMEEDWLYMDETVRSPQTEQALSSIARAVALLKSNVVVFIDGPDKRWTTTVKGVFLRDEFDVVEPISKRTLSAGQIHSRKSNISNAPVDIEFYTMCMQANKNGHIFGAFSNGASIYDRLSLVEEVGRMYGEPNDYFNDAYVEANYAYRVGLKFCAAKMSMDDTCNGGNIGDCGAVFKHIGGGRGTRPTKIEYYFCNDESWIIYGTKLYDMYPKKDCSESIPSIKEQLKLNLIYKELNAKANKKLFEKEAKIREQALRVVENSSRYRQSMAHLSDDEFDREMSELKKKAESPHQLPLW